MVNRQNWQDVKRFLAFQEGTRQNDPLTIKRIRSALRHLLEWADEIPLGNITRKEPTFPAYISKQEFTSAGGEKNLQYARMFFQFARLEWGRRYKEITDNWIKTIVPAKKNAAQSRLKKHKFYSIDDALKIAALWESADNQILKRGIAAFAFLFLSGMRITAFTTIPIECVNIAENEIYQLPEKGVITKNRKAAITHLLQIPELLKIVTEWDAFLRESLKPSDLWYPIVRRDWKSFKSNSNATFGRRSNFSEHLREICGMAGVSYLSPHKIRHGHVVYGLKNAKNLSELKAISQNVMHESIQITDAIYGNLSGEDVKKVISGIGQAAATAESETTQPADIQALVSLLGVLLKDNTEASALLSTFGKTKKNEKGK